MKIYYKTILMGETANPKYYETPDQVHEYKLLEMSPPCCEEMKEALDNEAIGFGEFQESILNRDCNLNFADCSPYPEGASWNEYAIKFCPFCGELVETEERERVSLKRVTRRVRYTIRDTIEVSE